MTGNSIIPVKYKVLSGSALKLIAAVAMLIDHIAVVFFSRNPIDLMTIGGKTISLYFILKLIGRISFPVFCCMLAEGARYTRNRTRYGIRLFVFALISEIPWNLEHTGTLFYSVQNVFFTLFLGYLGICVIERFQHHAFAQLCLLALLAVTTYFLRADYGIEGFGLIIIFYLLSNAPIVRGVLGICIIPNHLLTAHAFLLLGFYNGKRGFIKSTAAKLAFYAFYPAHIFVLYLLRYVAGIGA